MTLSPIRQEHLRPLFQVLEQVGVSWEERIHKGAQAVTVQCEKLRTSDLHITSRPYPGFSTDWGPMMQVLMTQVPGTGVFHETIFSQRFAHMGELMHMGAEIHPLEISNDEQEYNFVRTPGLFHAVQIHGPATLHGARVHANDVRAGAALVLAGLVARGKTEITGVEQIERGYEDFAARLNQLGVVIKQQEL